MTEAEESDKCFGILWGSDTLRTDFKRLRDSVDLSGTLTDSEESDKCCGICVSLILCGETSRA